jgi:hypothetical protein
MMLKTEPNITNPDEFYELLINAHKNLTSDESEKLNAKLILLLANHIGDMQVLKKAIESAKL